MSNQVYSTGRRKESIAKVWVSNGSGNIIINKKKIEDYFPDKALRMIINQPLEVAKKTSEIEGLGQVAVKLTFEPTWNKDMMSEDARLALGY